MSAVKTKTIKKSLFFIFGTISLVLAYIGVVMPGIPGIPFILLTAWFYLRSSDKMYNWILNHKIFGKLLNKFSQKDKVSLGFKLFVVSQLCVSVAVTLIWFVHDIYFQIPIVIAGIIVSIIIFRMKSTKF